MFKAPCLGFRLWQNMSIEMNFGVKNRFLTKFLVRGLNFYIVDWILDHLSSPFDCDHFPALNTASEYNLWIQPLNTASKYSPWRPPYFVYLCPSHDYCTSVMLSGIFILISGLLERRGHPSHSSWIKSFHPSSFWSILDFYRSLTFEPLTFSEKNCDKMRAHWSGYFYEYILYSIYSYTSSFCVSLKGASHQTRSAGKLYNSISLSRDMRRFDFKIFSTLSLFLMSLWDPH